MDIFNEIQKGQLEEILHKANILGDEETIQKAFSAIIEKGGKPAQMGEIREWQGKKFKKTPHGWEPVTEGKEESKKEEGKSSLNKRKQLKDYTLQEKIDLLKQAPKGTLASGGGYSPWVKTHSDNWLNRTTGVNVHSSELASRIGTFRDFKVK